MERTKFFQRKGKESHWHWQRKGNRKRWKRWCEIIRTSEHTENSKSMLELRENRSPIQGLLGEPCHCPTVGLRFSAELSCLSTILALRGTTTRRCAQGDQRKFHPSSSPHHLPLDLHDVRRLAGMLHSLQNRQPDASNAFLCVADQA